MQRHIALSQRQQTRNITWGQFDLHQEADATWACLFSGDVQVAVVEVDRQSKPCQWPKKAQQSLSLTISHSFGGGG